MKSNEVILYLPESTAGRVKFYIPYMCGDEREAFKKINGSFYHPHQRLWSLPNTKQHLKKARELFGKELKEVSQKRSRELPQVRLSDMAQNELDLHYQKMKLKGYSDATIRNYQHNLKQFLCYFEGANYREIEKEQIEGFVFELVNKYQISEQKQNVMVNAIKSYYELTLNMPREYYEITRPKRSKNLPNVLSEKEVFVIINQPKNIKHKAILYTIYSAGLRVGEVIRLRVKDIHSDEGYIFVKDSKGKKDRHTVLSPKLLTILRHYYKKHKPSYWLFEGQDGGQYSVKSIQNVYRKAVDATNSNPWSTPHTLRHSFATHLMKRGINIRFIQSALGHNSSKTTEIYTRVLHINNKTLKSPLDLLTESSTFDSEANNIRP